MLCLALSFHSPKKCAITGNGKKLIIAQNEGMAMSGSMRKEWDGLLHGKQLTAERSDGISKGVLVAISIPNFTSQLEKSREATDLANIRSKYAEVVANALTDPDKDQSVPVNKKQTVEGWVSTGDVAGVDITNINSKTGTTITYTASTGVVAIDGHNVVASNGEGTNPENP